MAYTYPVRVCSARRHIGGDVLAIFVSLRITVTCWQIQKPPNTRF